MSSVSPPSYLLLTRKGYFSRIRVPRHLQHKLKKRELKKAIAGLDRHLAARQAILYAAQALKLFNSLEDGHLVSKKNYVLQMVVELADKTKLHLDKQKTLEELQMLVKAGIIQPGQTSNVQLDQVTIAPDFHAPLVGPEDICTRLPLAKGKSAWKISACQRVDQRLLVR